jgi:hypothetical protein
LTNTKTRARKGGPMPVLDGKRYRALTLAIRYLVTNDKLARGHQAQLAQHFDVSRQRVNQIVTRERIRKLNLASGHPTQLDS